MSIFSKVSSMLLCGIVMASNCFAETVIVPIPTNSVDVTYTPTGYTTPVTIIGHGAWGTQAVPGWTWNYTGNFAEERYPMYMSWFNESYACLGPVNGIGYFYDCNSDDNLPPLGNDYDGYEFHYFTFELPIGAQSPRINFNALGSDDRVVVTLNGHELAAIGGDLYCPEQPTWDHIGPDGMKVRRDFIPQTSDLWFDEPSFFQTGINVLRMWVNNTGLQRCGSPRTHSGGNSGSVVRGFLTYELEEDEITPDEMINELLLSFDEGMAAGDLSGVGPGKSAEHRANAMRNKLLEAQSLIEAEDYQSAIQILHEVAKLSDGVGNEFIEGDGRANFNSAVLELIDALQQALP